MASATWNPKRIFQMKQTQDLLLNKYVVFLGDSVIRGMYKDLLVLLTRGDRLLEDSDLRAKGEQSFLDDGLLYGGRKGHMHNGVNYREAREFNNGFNLIKYYFITRIYDSYVEKVISDQLDGKYRMKPDVFIVNSCLWDLARYGASTGSTEFMDRARRLMEHLKRVLPPSCLVLFLSAVPVSQNVKGGFMLKNVAHLNHILRFDVLEANQFIANLCDEFGFDFLDIHWHLKDQLHLREKDGVHWRPKAHRRLTNLILTHLSDAWREPPPPLYDPLKSREPSSLRRAVSRDTDKLIDILRTRLKDRASLLSDETGQLPTGRSLQSGNRLPAITGSGGGGPQIPGGVVGRLLTPMVATGQGAMLQAGYSGLSGARGGMLPQTRPRAFRASSVGGGVGGGSCPGDGLLPLPRLSSSMSRPGQPLPMGMSNGCRPQGPMPRTRLLDLPMQENLQQMQRQSQELPFQQLTQPAMPLMQPSSSDRYGGPIGGLAAANDRYGGGGSMGASMNPLDGGMVLPGGGSEVWQQPYRQEQLRGPVRPGHAVYHQQAQMSRHPYGVGMGNVGGDARHPHRQRDAFFFGN